MDFNSENYYEVLGISSDSSLEEITIRYRYLVRVFHPDRLTLEKDRVQAEDDLKKINVAYSTLSDKERRQKYDQELERKKSNTNQADEPLYQSDPKIEDVFDYIRLTEIKWRDKWDPIPKNDRLSALWDATSALYFIIQKNAYSFESEGRREEKFKEFQGRFFYVISSGVALGLEKKKNGLPKNIDEDRLLFVNSLMLYTFLSDLADKNFSYQSAVSDTLNNQMIDISLKVSFFGYEDYSHQVKIKVGPNPDLTANHSPQGTIRKPNNQPPSTKISFGCVVFLILILVVIISIAISGQGASSVQVPTPTNSKKSSDLASTKATPTKLIRPSATTPSCKQWDAITTKDKGKNLCVYGIVSDTFFEGDTFNITFGNRDSDFRFLVFDGYYFSEIIGHCVMAEGIIRTDIGTPYIEVINDLYKCDY